MNPVILIPADALALTQTILATLILGSGVAVVLKHVVAKGQPHTVIDNIAVRVKAWWVMTALLGLAFLLGQAGVFAALCSNRT